MDELVKYMITALVDDKESVKVELNENSIVVHVAKSDMGKVIGKQGRIVKALRQIVKAASVKAGKDYSLEIAED